MRTPLRRSGRAITNSGFVLCLLSDALRPGGADRGERRGREERERRKNGSVGEEEGDGEENVRKAAKEGARGGEALDSVYVYLPAGSVCGGRELIALFGSLQYIKALMN